MDTQTHEPASPGGGWRLTAADHILIAAKSRANRLGFAIMLLFFRERGRFPRSADAIDAETIMALATSEDDDVESPTPGARALLNFVRGDPGRASVDSVMREVERLETIRAIGLPADLFAGALPHEVELYRQRVAVQPPSDLRRLPDAVRITWLAAFVHLRGRVLTDSLIELLIETVHAIGARAERRVEQQVLNELRQVSGKWDSHQATNLSASTILRRAAA